MVTMNKIREEDDRLNNAPKRKLAPGKRGGRDRSSSRDSKKRGGRNENDRNSRSSKKGRGRTDSSRRRGGEKKDSAPPKQEKSKGVEVSSHISVRELAGAMGISPIDLIKELMRNGIMANINQQLDYETAIIVAEDMGYEVQEKQYAEPEETVEEEELDSTRQFMYAEEAPEDMRPRPPIVTVMGHVDHGKTSLLDAIRDTDVQAGEVGGITQHIGAYQVTAKEGQKITFVDTPGHEAFTQMRARGAQVTDVAVLVVAADDGVQPQTREAYDHASAAQVPIIVALNKIDKPEADQFAAKQQLSELGLMIEEWGGETICVPVSARDHIGLEDLLDSILIVAELRELKANPNSNAKGTVIEAELDRSRGTVATLVVQNGTLHRGDTIVVNNISGNVRAMFDYHGNQVKEAPPSTPVAVLGLPEVPQAGDIFEVVENEKAAREIISDRAEEQRTQTTQRAGKMTLDDLYAQFQTGDVKELNIILKADVQGSLEPIVSSLEQLGEEDLKVNIIHQGLGDVSESDIMLATASNAIVIGYEVNIDAAARRVKETEQIDVRLYDVIYKLIEDVNKALTGMLEPVYEEVILGHAEVRAVFKIPKIGNIAGTYVTDGEIARNARARVHRDGEVIHTGPIGSLKRFTKDVTEVNTNYECGIGLDGFNAFKVGDVIEAFTKERVR